MQARFKVPVQRRQRRQHGGARRALAGRGARGANDFVLLTLGAGVGAGIVIGGRLHHGHHWYAGEISRMTLDYREWQVDFGERGYLESRISAASIPEWSQRARCSSDRARTVRPPCA